MVDSRLFTPRRRQTTKTRTEAEAIKRRWSSELSDLPVANAAETFLSAAQLRDAEGAIRRLGDRSLTFAIDYFLTHYREPRSDLTVKDAALLYLRDLGAVEVEGEKAEKILLPLRVPSEMRIPSSAREQARALNQGKGARIQPSGIKESKHRRYSTLGGKLRIVRRFVERFEASLLSQISVEDVREFMDSCSKERSKRETRERMVTQPKTWNNIRGDLAAFFSW